LIPSGERPLLPAMIWDVTEAEYPSEFRSSRLVAFDGAGRIFPGERGARPLNEYPTTGGTGAGTTLDSLHGPVMGGSARERLRALVQGRIIRSANADSAARILDRFIELASPATLPHAGSVSQLLGRHDLWPDAMRCVNALARDLFPEASKHRGGLKPSTNRFPLEALPVCSKKVRLRGGRGSR